MYLPLAFALGMIAVWVYTNREWWKLRTKEIDLANREQNLISWRREIELEKRTSIEFAQQKIKQAEDFVQAARKQSNDLIKSAEHEAWTIKKFAQWETEKMMSKLDTMQFKLEQKETRLDEKIAHLDQAKELLTSQKIEIDVLRESHLKKLNEISGLTNEQAKNQLFEHIERQYSDDIALTIQKYKNSLQDDLDNQAINLISKVLPRISSDHVSEFTVTTIDIPSEDIKGRLIGREWRNVAIFEKTTGVELIIDDTPGIVRLSSYDHGKRFIATNVVRKLIKDGRISPVYIQKIYDETVSEFDQLMIEKWKDALLELWLPPQHPDITQLIWQFTLRYSYGQNLYYHSIEVAKFAELMANELWLDGQLAKKAGLLHDIWKVVAEQWQSHTFVGADVLRKYWYDDVTINTAEWHHHDVPMTSPIGWIVTAADALSASRPWARFNSKEFFIQKMSKLEELVNSVQWVDKTYIMQAWREIMVFVNPSEVDDAWVHTLVKKIAQTVEAQLDYPGMIRVVALRETKVIDYLR